MRRRCTIRERSLKKPRRGCTAKKTVRGFQVVLRCFVGDKGQPPEMKLEAALRAPMESAGGQPRADSLDELLDWLERQIANHPK